MKKCCLSCKKELQGRSDKKFCDNHCKSAYHYNKSITGEARFYNKVDNQLKLNRRILKNFNKAGKTTIKAQVLIDQGFNAKFFTHYWKSNSKNIYLFVYEYGFLKKTENNVIKYILIQWQDYMLDT